MVRVAQVHDGFGGTIKKIVPDPLTISSSDGLITSIGGDWMTDLSSPVNSLAYCDGAFVAGLSSGSVLLSSKDSPASFTPIYNHSKNVCSLSFSCTHILSGSWDDSAILYDIVSGSQTRLAHPGSVWSSAIIDNKHCITGCADGSIRIFKNAVLYRIIQYHTSPVRSLIISGSVFNNLIIYSVENNGTVHKTNINGELLASRRVGEFFYTICRWNDLLVVGGTSGKLVVLNFDLQVESTASVGDSDVWDLKADGTKLYATGNGKLYELEEGEEEREKIADENPKYKIINNQVYQEINGKWEIIGDKVEDEKEMNESFKVELGNKEYTLSFNKSENTHEVANRFIRQNGLGMEHHQEIVDFINLNYRQTKVYKKYKGINIKGIEKLTENEELIKILKEINNGIEYVNKKSDERNVYKLEELLMEKKEKEGRIEWKARLPLFVIFDICRYAIAKQLDLDLTFMMSKIPETKKEAKAFAQLMANLVEDPPFELKVLDERVKKLRDIGLLDRDDVEAYEENKAVKRRIMNKQNN